METRITIGATILSVLLVATSIGVAGGGSQQPSSDPACRIEWAPMRDGVKLATEVYLPASPGTHPVIMTRTPYNRRYTASGSNCDNKRLIELARRGYVGLNQDVRGR